MAHLFGRDWSRSEGNGRRYQLRKASHAHYIEWRVMAEGQYAVGVEPCTNGFGREAAKAAGELIVLKPGESRRYRTELSILDGMDEIERFRQTVGYPPA